MKAADQQPKPRKDNRRVTVVPMWVDVVKSMSLEAMTHLPEFHVSWLVDGAGTPVRRFTLDEVPFGRPAFGHRQTRTKSALRANVKRDVELAWQQHDAMWDRQDVAGLHASAQHRCGNSAERIER